jgi:hypothetical protein
MLPSLLSVCLLQHAALPCLLSACLPS